MGNVKISFCIPVYNQTEMVHECISEIIQYRGDDIEIVVNDDCSTENIKKIVDDFSDPRVKYFRNKENLGHDLNILQCFRNAEAPYGFLLRVRDRIMANGIPLMIERIKKNPNTGYLTGQALDENGNTRLAYNIEHYHKGREALEAHKRIYLHPSGSLYAIKLLNLDAIESFIINNINNKYGFLVHSIIRLELALKGDFELIKEPIWQYTDTTNSKDIAVNSTKNKLSVYAPSFVKQRYHGEILWANEILEESDKIQIFKWLFSRYLDACTWGFKRRNEDVNLQKHYNTYKMEFSVMDERKQFLKYSNEILKSLIQNEKLLVDFNKHCSKVILQNTTYYLFRFYLAKILRKTPIYKIYLWSYIYYRDNSKGWRF